MPALRLITRHVDSLQPAHVDWYLDRPVSNSGRLKVLMAELLAERASFAESIARSAWNIQVVDSPDRQLIDHQGVVISSDSAVLDGCRTWMNLAREVIAKHVPGAWIADLMEP